MCRIEVCIEFCIVRVIILVLTNGIEVELQRFTRHGLDIWYHYEIPVMKLVVLQLGMC